ncbi:hypothetical protein VYU27_009768, partial [Nannochloropsis oceanica]
YSGENQSQDRVVLAPKRSSLRTPSYTDRILTHSLPGKNHCLRWRHYDMADHVALSDHRPVCAALELNVDRSIRGFGILPPPSLPHSHPESTHEREPEATAIADDLVLFHIFLGRPRLEGRLATSILSGRSSGSGIGCTRGSSSTVASSLSSPTLLFKSPPYEVTVLFPLVSEDPLVDQRQFCTLGDAFPGFGPLREDGEEMGGVERGAGGPKTANNANLNSRQRAVSQGAALSEHQQRQQQQMGGKDDKEVPLGGVKHVPWALFPQTMHVVASRRFSEHILIKIKDSHNRDLGQAVIPVALGFPPGATDFKASSALPAFPEVKERVRVALSSGGVFKGTLVLDMSVIVQALPSKLAKHNSTIKKATNNAPASVPTVAHTLTNKSSAPMVPTLAPSSAERR